MHIINYHGWTGHKIGRIPDDRGMFGLGARPDTGYLFVKSQMLNLIPGPSLLQGNIK